MLGRYKTLFLKRKEEIVCKSPSSLVEDVGAGDEVDIVQGLVINEMVEKLSLRDKEHLSKIESALQRIDEGVFGQCQDCEDPIPEKRIEAVPLCTTCINCAELKEKFSRQFAK